ncbi:MAG TPA: hypothetical protein VGO90_09000 [Chthoniobacteraceae bacterium]|nr:hypothetical protein [Chthoniobacteraceae bacterium]
MSRPTRTLCTISLLALSCAITGCSTAYSRMYSPKKTNYVRPPEKAGPSAAELLQQEPTTSTPNFPSTSPSVMPDSTAPPTAPELPPVDATAPPADASAPIPGL